MPWPNDILGSNLVPPYALNRTRANLYVLRGQVAEAQALIAEEPLDGASDPEAIER
jgi:hypothetical protein